MGKDKDIGLEFREEVYNLIYSDKYKDKITVDMFVAAVEFLKFFLYYEAMIETENNVKLSKDNKPE